jgi:plasmid stability protein
MKKSYTIKDMPEKLHWDLKMQAMVEHKTMQVLIIEILTNYLTEKAEGRG